MGSARAALRRLLDPEALLQLCPVGLAYGLGDFLQTLACNAASAPVVLVVGQTKLLLAALLSCWLLPGRKPTNWFRLAVISCAAAASTDIGAENAAAERHLELHGALLALIKAGLSSMGAVLSERYFKGAHESFWVVSFRVQLMMLCSSLVIMPYWGLQDASLSEFFLRGPHPVCGDLPVGLPGKPCVDHRGWDEMTVLATLAIVLNGLSTGLMLKHLSAVTKSVCNAVGAGVFYVTYVLLGYRPFNVAQANIMAIVIISSYEYATENLAAKHRTSASLP